MSRPSQYDLPDDPYVQSISGIRTPVEELDNDTYLRNLDLDRLEGHWPVEPPRRST